MRRWAWARRSARRNYLCSHTIIADQIKGLADAQVGLGEAEREAVLRTVAAVLHLVNIVHTHNKLWNERVWWVRGWARAKRSARRCCAWSHSQQTTNLGFGGCAGGPG